MHHKTYERLGAEFDADLEVVCVTCHEAETIDASEQRHDAIYLRLGRVALRRQPFAEIADLAEDVKQLCADHHVPYDSGRISRALELLIGTRLSRPMMRGRQVTPAEIVEMTAHDAHEILARLRSAAILTDGAIRTINPGPTESDLAAHEARVLSQARTARGHSEPRRPSLRERIDAIFAGRL